MPSPSPTQELDDDSIEETVVARPWARAALMRVGGGGASSGGIASASVDLPATTRANGSKPRAAMSSTSSFASSSSLTSTRASASASAGLASSALTGDTAQSTASGDGALQGDTAVGGSLRHSRLLSGALVQQRAKAAAAVAEKSALRESALADLFDSDDDVIVPRASRPADYPRNRAPNPPSRSNADHSRGRATNAFKKARDDCSTDNDDDDAAVADIKDRKAKLSAPARTPGAARISSAAIDLTGPSPSPNAIPSRASANDSPSSGTSPAGLQSFTPALTPHFHSSAVARAGKARAESGVVASGKRAVPRANAVSNAPTAEGRATANGAMDSATTARFRATANAARERATRADVFWRQKQADIAAARSSSARGLVALGAQGTVPSGGDRVSSASSATTSSTARESGSAGAAEIDVVVVSSDDDDDDAPLDTLHMRSRLSGDRQAASASASSSGAAAASARRAGAAASSARADAFAGGAQARRRGKRKMRAARAPTERDEPYDSEDDPDWTPGAPFVELDEGPILDMSPSARLSKAPRHRQVTSGMLPSFFFSVFFPAVLCVVCGACACTHDFSPVHAYAHCSLTWIVAIYLQVHFPVREHKLELKGRSHRAVAVVERAWRVLQQALR
jgi:predicted dithiol-disulfide oxidoreductase (DUF899 family)